MTLAGVPARDAFIEVATMATDDLPLELRRSVRHIALVLAHTRHGGDVEPWPLQSVASRLLVQLLKESEPGDLLTPEVFARFAADAFQDEVVKQVVVSAARHARMRTASAWSTKTRSAVIALARADPSEEGLHRLLATLGTATSDADEIAFPTESPFAAAARLRLAPTLSSSARTGLLRTVWQDAEECRPFVASYLDRLARDDRTEAEEALSELNSHIGGAFASDRGVFAVALAIASSRSSRLSFVLQDDGFAMPEPIRVHFSSV
jgi:hypothetical protein